MFLELLIDEFLGTRMDEHQTLLYRSDQQT